MNGQVGKLLQSKTKTLETVIKRKRKLNCMQTRRFQHPVDPGYHRWLDKAMAQGTAASQGAAHEDGGPREQDGGPPERAASNVTVRLAHERDLPGLAELRWQWALEQHDRSELPPLEEFIAATADWSQRHCDSHIPFVAVLSTETVGMAWLAIVPRVLAPLNPDRASGDIQSCFVVPKLRGKGLGHRLVTCVVDDGRRRGLDYITAHSSEGAVRMYERAGFKQYSALLGRSTV